MHRLVSTTLMIALLLAATNVNAQDASEDAAAAQAAFIESLKLAPEHAVFKRQVGTWNVEMKTFFEDPENPQTNKGTATFKLLFGGRYLQQEYQGEFSGLPFEGRGLSGYDKTKKKFVGTWVDNFETGILMLEGTYDEKTKTLTEHGVSHMPTGKAAMRNVTKEIDEDTFVFTMFMKPEGAPEARVMEITYRRAK